MHLEIVACDVIPLSWRLGRRTANAHHTWQTREVVLLRVRAADGSIGWGEAAPLPGFSADDLEACRAELATAPLRAGQVPIDGDIEATLRAAVASSGLRSAASVYCLEMALLDLIGKIRREPAWRLLRPDAAGAPVELAALLRETIPDAVAAEAREVLARGINTAKLKIGGDGSALDGERLRALRGDGLDSLSIRLDANQSLDIDHLDEKLAALASFGVELLEEPVPDRDWLAIHAPPIPLAMDESLMRDGWRERVRICGERGTCAALILKPMALGGIGRCLDVARLAEQLGLRVAITHLFDGPIAAAATAELAVALDGQLIACGLDTFGRREDWPVPGPDQIEGASIRPGTRPGLGVESLTRSIEARARDAGSALA